jgi:hypothetical protein
MRLLERRSREAVARSDGRALKLPTQPRTLVQLCSASASSAAQFSSLPAFIHFAGVSSKINPALVAPPARAVPDALPCASGINPEGNVPSVPPMKACRMRRRTKLFHTDCALHRSLADSRTRPSSRPLGDSSKTSPNAPLDDPWPVPYKLRAASMTNEPSGRAVSRTRECVDHVVVPSAARNRRQFGKSPSTSPAKTRVTQPSSPVLDPVARALARCAMPPSMFRKITQWIG